MSLSIASSKTTSEFKSIFDDCKLMVSAENIFYHSIRLIKDKYKILDRETYLEFYENIVKDIELKTSPIDCFIPLSDEEIANSERPTGTHYPEFDVNRCVAEYERISKRITLEDLYNTFPNTHEIYVSVENNPSILQHIVDDVFTHYCVYRYLDEIEKSRIKIFSIATPLIEYIVNTISLNDLQEFISSQRIKPEKCTKYLNDVFFLPEFKLIKKYYLEEHGEVPSMDIDVIIQKLASNIVYKSDIYIIIGIYILLSFAMTDIRNEMYDSECVTYVKDVISRL